MINFLFHKRLRLSKSIHFSYVFQNPIKIGNSEIIILGRENTLDYPRLGLSISRKHIKRSSSRNRIKRLVRESFRLSQYKLIKMDFIVIAKRDIGRLNNSILKKILEHLWFRYYQFFPNI